jgi:ribosomal protein S18 acetylase RimI-like enzyme
MDKKANQRSITFRPITDEDLEFLHMLYASTRQEELSITNWSTEEKEKFLRKQFEFQHVDYMKNYQNAQFDIVLIDGEPAGRLYVDRRKNEIRIIDIALLPNFRRKGIGSKLMNDLIAEADEKQVTLSLHVEMNNPAIGLYERLEFKRGVQQGIYYLMERKPGNRK